MNKKRTILLTFLMSGFCLSGTGVWAQDATAVPPPNVPLQNTIGVPSYESVPVPTLMVLNADGASIADGVLTLTGISNNTILFADRPVRAAGHQTTEQFINQWGNGTDSFAADPPNATVSVLGGAGDEVADAVVTLTNPALIGTTLTFQVTVLEGNLVGDGPAAVFIDNGHASYHGGGHRPTGGDRPLAAEHAEDPIRAPVATAATAGAVARTTYHAEPEYHGAWYGATSPAPMGYAFPPDCGSNNFPPCWTE